LPAPELPAFPLEPPFAEPAAPLEPPPPGPVVSSPPQSTTAVPNNAANNHVVTTGTLELLMGAPFRASSETSTTWRRT
jgi:hypothetical protein